MHSAAAYLLLKKQPFPPLFLTPVPDARCPMPDARVQVHRLRDAAYGRLGSRDLAKLFDLFDTDGNRELVG